MNRFYRSTFNHSGVTVTLDHGGENLTLAREHGQHVARVERYQWLQTRPIKESEARKMGEFVNPRSSR